MLLCFTAPLGTLKSVWPCLWGLCAAVGGGGGTSPLSNASLGGGGGSEGSVPLGQCLQRLCLFSHGHGDSRTPTKAMCVCPSAPSSRRSGWGGLDKSVGVPGVQWGGGGVGVLAHQQVAPMPLPLSCTAPSTPQTQVLSPLPPPCPAPPPPYDIPSGRRFFTGPWTVTRSSLRMLRRVAVFCRPLRPVLLLVSFPRLRSPVVGVLGLCWMRRDVPFAHQWRPISSPPVLPPPPLHPSPASAPLPPPPHMPLSLPLSLSGHSLAGPLALARAVRRGHLNVKVRGQT